MAGGREKEENREIVGENRLKRRSGSDEGGQWGRRWPENPARDVKA